MGNLEDNLELNPYDAFVQANKGVPPTADQIRLYSKLFQSHCYYRPDIDNVSPKDMAKPFVPSPFYDWARGFMTRGAIEMFVACQDVESGDYGILTVVRKNSPMINQRWVLGGELKKGLSRDGAVIDLTKKECGLDINQGDIIEIGGSNVRFGIKPQENIYGEAYFPDGTRLDPLKFVTPGVHDFARTFYVSGTGSIKLRGDLEKDPLIVTPEIWANRRRELGLDYYMEGLMDISQILLKDDFYSE